MNKGAQTENSRTLAAALGIGEEKALALLSVAVAITFDPKNSTSAMFAGHVAQMVSRTVESVILENQTSQQSVSVELVIGSAKPRFATTHVFAGIGHNEVLIGSEPFPEIPAQLHPVGLLLGACYAVGAILKKTFKELLPFPSADNLKINLAELVGGDLSLLDDPVDFDEAYLAGAGAIGNGFVYGLSQFKISGTLHVVDDDTVSDGNLQRCVYFMEAQVGLPKSDCLCGTIESILPTVRAIPYKMRLQDVPAKKSGAWLKRLIVGVDSPRARRSLQSEIPGEVFDASTTGITEVVVHFNRQPTDLACMSCLYYESPQEHAHELHVAESLGVTVESVRQERISWEVAKTIHARNSAIPISELEGLAYDTLFKKLCSTGQLNTPEGKQVLAPFAFISVLAGTILAIEFVRRVQNSHSSLFNEWHISPWMNPVLRLRRISGKNPKCEFCSNEVFSRLKRRFWQAA